MLTWTVSLTLRRFECGSVQMKPASTSFSCSSMRTMHQQQITASRTCRVLTPYRRAVQRLDSSC
jgi:hypothetical protein